MNKQTRIALDVDDVLAAFTPHAFAFYKTKLEGRLDYWSTEVMNNTLGEGWFTDRIMNDKNFWDTLPVLSPARDIDFPVTCYVSSFPADMYASRLNWLTNNGYPKAPLIVSSDKLDICHRFGITHLIDDKPDTIKSLERNPIMGLHFMTPYAGFKPVGDYSIHSLKHVKNYL